MNFVKRVKLALPLLVAAFAIQQPAQSMQHLPKITQTLKNNKAAAITTALALPAIIGATWLYKKINKQAASLCWDWKKIDPATINGQPIAQFFKSHAQKLAKDNDTWLWGSGTSAHQVEGGCTKNNWPDFVKNNPETHVDAGRACDHWNKYKEDIKLMADNGLNCYRFSVEWSKVMPQPGVVDESVLDHYQDVCNELIKYNIKPAITLYHYTEPKWFTDLDGFEKAENIEHFVKFCTTVFKKLHKHVHVWFTFNAPEGYAMTGWVKGMKPPAKKDRWDLMPIVFNNLLNAHVKVYQAIKALPGGKESRIGVLKNIFQLDPHRPFHPLDRLASFIGNALQNDTMYNFFNHGKATILVPGKVWYTLSNDYIKNGGKALDFVGLNYYCHGYTQGTKVIRDTVNEIPANNELYTIYGEGLHRAITELSNRLAKPLGIPIYVTENGIGTTNDEHRTLFLQRYLYALACAIADGHDVRGYMYWSFMDNYEWGSFSKRYGLFHVDYDSPELTRTLKPSARTYIDLVKACQLS
jgi:beta-glucosidase